MIKRIFLILICNLITLLYINGQQFATELFHWENDTLVGSWAYDNTYNECWGIEINNREFAIIGSTQGTHFFDITDPINSIQVAFVEGAYTGTGVIHRDYHDFQGYLYAVCDEGSASTLQIIDLTYLPDSVHVVYDSNALFRKAHNIFIDTATAKLYACASTNYAMDIYSLNNPTSPILIYSYNDVGHVHDAYVRNDTAYLNCGNDGLRIIDFTYLDLPGSMGPVELASLTSYHHNGYNHSGWLNNDGTIYAMQDENHGYDVKVFDVSDLSNITLLSNFNAGHPQSMAHNGIIKDNLLYIAYYHNGLKVYDISDPSNPIETCHYETYLCGDHNSYKGAWGVYPYLSSGNIIVSDMQSGLFILNCNINATWNCVSGKCEDPGDGSGIYTNLNDCQSNCGVPSWNCNNGICEDPGDGTGIYASQNCCEAECIATNIDDNLEKSINIFPNPVINNLIIRNQESAILKLYDIYGKKVKEEKITSNYHIIDRNIVESGIYFYQLNLSGKYIENGKIILK